MKYYLAAYTCINKLFMEKETQERTLRSQQAMIIALETYMGNVTRAAKAANISIPTHYRWLKEDDGYQQQVLNIRDICFGKMKDTLLEKALKRIDKGDSTVLNQLLRIYFKNLPEEIETIRRFNRPLIRAKIKYVDVPDWLKEDKPTG